ncbi:hypothetical protein F5890DRAFT_1559270 [Lentinula detonsa]|uniref:Uncharacterized protein n=1 Tax=Lentinula detonsa TaxID=2804962 RepID=A0AA38UPG5_9AGAR|nr:hypothetical protein F5890DRAFT_1559270 [Lentinula detonsa]
MFLQTPSQTLIEGQYNLEPVFILSDLFIWETESSSVTRYAVVTTGKTRADINQLEIEYGVELDVLVQSVASRLGLEMLEERGRGLNARIGSGADGEEGKEKGKDGEREDKDRNRVRLMDRDEEQDVNKEKNEEDEEENDNGDTGLRQQSLNPDLDFDVGNDYDDYNVTKDSER